MNAVAFSGDGALVLAPRTEELSSLAAAVSEDAKSVGVSDPVVWCQALDPRGNLLLGTGHSGRILQITPRGEVSLLAQLPEPEVTALLTSRNGEIYAATSPNGAVYRLGADGEARVFYEPEQRYIWTLAEDASGVLYAGTGEAGKLFRISAKGDGSLLYDSREPHITALLVDRSGSLIAGTDGTGKIYRIDHQKVATVLYDSNYREIVDLSMDGSGQIYAAAVSAGVGEIPPPAPRLLVRTPEDASRVPASEEVSPVHPEVRPRDRETLEAEFEGVPLTGTVSRQAREGGGAVFRITQAGIVEDLWKSTEEVPYALAATANGIVYVGTGEPARLLRLEDKGRAVALAKFPQGQLTDLVFDPTGRLFAVTSNSGAAYRISRDQAETGTYISPVRDAGVRARWGRIRWDATKGSGQKVEIQTRTGNSALPDETWTDWAPVYPDSEGSEIVSPEARYIQWQARLTRTSPTAPSPMLRSVTVTYLPRNRAPRIRELKLLARNEVPSAYAAVSDATSDSEGTEETPSAKVCSPRKASSEPSAKEDAPKETVKLSRPRVLVWHAEDPDDDRLVYRILLQKEGEDRWVEAGADLTDSTCTLDESSWPEGRYKLKAIATDAPSNYAGEALEVETTSEGAVIDLSAPVLELLKPAKGRTDLQVRAHDPLSPIESAEILSGNRTVAVARPADGVLDSRMELLQIEVPPISLSEDLRLKVRDAAGNEAVIDLREGIRSRL